MITVLLFKEIQLIMLLRNNYNSYLFTPLQNVLSLLEVNYGFLGAEELRDEGKK